METLFLTLLIMETIAFGTYVYLHPPISNRSILNKDEICLDYSNETINTLSVGLMHELAKGYRNHQLVYINDRMRQDNISLTDGDSHSILFKIEPLKKFIYHLEVLASKQGVSSNDLGLRLYYGRYPDIKTWTSKYQELEPFSRDPETVDYGRRHTAVFIPTITRNGVDLDFDPQEKDTYNGGINGCSTDYYLDVTSSNPVSGLPGIPSTSRATGARNHGKLYPPLGDSGHAF